MNITIGDAAESYYQLRQKYGLYYNPSNREIMEKAIQLKHKKNILIGINLLLIILVCLFILMSLSVLAIAPPVDYSQQQQSSQQQEQPVNIVRQGSGDVSSPQTTQQLQQQVLNTSFPAASGCWLGKYSNTKYLRSLCSFSGFWDDFASVFQKWIGFKIIFAALAIILGYWLFGKIFNRP